MLNWYLQSGKEADVVISTRIRLARNLDEILFTTKYSLSDAEKIIQIFGNIIPSLPYELKLLKLKDMDYITKLSLVEKHIISPNFVTEENETKAILINEEENICIMLNEEDHIRIQVLASGLDLENTLGLAVEIDEKLANLINYAYNEKYGFLTSCPTNVGTGLRSSVMVHLPGLTLTSNINKVLEVVNNFGMNIRGVYGEGTKSQGNIYQISNKQSLGISEEEIIKNLKAITDKIIEQERLARKYLAKNAIELEDTVCRAYGTLTNCKKISGEEVKRLLSDVKLGVDMGIIKEITDYKIKQLETFTKPANMQKYLGTVLDGYDRDIKRAEVIQKIINE
ncbi:MAG: protein arginine kinase [Oscillospiraceae bacterium]|nr:protein arginine kinase [Oscillospiraceae bacterium]